MSTHRYPLNALRAFEAAGRTGSFVAAGEELAVTPAAVSQQVKRLEDYLDDALFVRLPHGLKLTDTGSHLLPELSAVFARLNQVVCAAGHRPTTSLHQAATASESLVGVGKLPPEEGRPSIVVLPFVNKSGDTDQEYFADGLSEDVVTALAKFRTLHVISWHSSVRYKTRSVSAAQFAVDLGVSYLVEGSVRRAGGRIRVTAELVEAATGKHVWAERYDRALDDVFALQDELTATIVATVGGRVTSEGWRRVRRAGATFEAYDLLLRAQALHFRITKTENREARELAERALNLEGGDPRPHMLLSAIHLMDYWALWSSDPRHALGRAVAHGKRSVNIDETDSLAHAHLAEALLYDGRVDEASTHFEIALKLNPADATARAMFGFHLTKVGRAKDALVQYQMAADLDPFEQSWVPWIRAKARYAVRDYARAIDDLLQANDAINDVRLWLAASYAQVKQTKTAGTYLTEYLHHARQEMPLFPGVEFENWPGLLRAQCDCAEDFEHLQAGLRVAWEAAVIEP